MKTFQIILKNNAISFLCSFSLICLNGCRFIGHKDNNAKENEEYYVAAYVWPSQHDEPRSRELLWSVGIGEVETLLKGKD